MSSATSRFGIFCDERTSTTKKSLLASEQDRPDVARKRARWRKYQGLIDPSHLVFIDETWTKTNMAPLRGWCEVGRRLRDQVPFGRWKTMTFLAALRHDRITAPCLIDGPINGARFRAYVEQFVVPTLHPGDLVIMDNLGSHKGRAVRDAIASVGARRLFLPAYSPDSIRSSRSLQNSRRCSGRPGHGPSRPSPMPSQICFTHSAPKNAQTISETAATLQSKANML